MLKSSAAAAQQGCLLSMRERTVISVYWSGLQVLRSSFEIQKMPDWLVRSSGSGPASHLNIVQTVVSCFLSHFNHIEPVEPLHPSHNCSKDCDKMKYSIIYFVEF